MLLLVYAVLVENYFAMAVLSRNIHVKTNTKNKTNAQCKL